MKIYRVLLNNFAYLYILQATNIIIPLIVLPYLIRVLGVEKFGLISFAQIIATYFIILVDFGFNLSIVRLISINSRDNKKLSEIFSSVIIIKLIILICSFFILLFLVSEVPKFKKDEAIYFYMFGLVVGIGLFPLWFFQGMQEMKYITIINFIVKITFLISVISFIHYENDYLIYPILLSASHLLVLPFSWYLVKNKFNIEFIMVDLNTVIYYVKYSSHFFISRVSVKLYEGGGIFLLGLVSSDLVVGYYAIADKLRNAMVSLYKPISQALYPYIAKEKDIALYKIIFILSNIINIIGVTILFFYTKEIFHLLFGIEANISISIAKIFSFVIAVEIPSILIGYPLLGALGHPNFVNYSLVITAVFYLVISLIMFYFDNISPENLAILYLVSVIFEFLLRFYGVVKYKLWK